MTSASRIASALTAAILAVAVPGASASRLAALAAPAEGGDPREAPEPSAVVDHPFIAAASRKFVFDSLTAQLDRLLGDGTRVMVVAKNNRVEVVQQPTVNRAEIVAALDRESKVATANYASEVRRVVRSIQRGSGVTENRTDGPGTTAAPLTETALSDARSAFQEARMHSEREFSEVCQSLSILRSFLGSLAGLPGRKAVLYAADRLPARAGELVWQAWADKYAVDWGVARRLLDRNRRLTTDRRRREPAPRAPRLCDDPGGRAGGQLEPLGASSGGRARATAGRLTEPPFRLLLDVGGENRPHVIEVTATDTAGESTTRAIVTGRIEVHEEVDLELQQLFVTVTRNDQRVLDLSSEDFEVLDDGRRQQMVTFERGDVPLTAVLLIDSSLSMEGEALAAALAGGRAFIENMLELDEAKMIVFSDRVKAATPFTGEEAVASSVMETVAASGDTAINDHLYLALKELDSRPGRQVIVLLSDGLDVESVLDMADVEWKAGRMQSLIYWIRPSSGADLGESYLSMWRNPEEHRREISALKRLVDASGGRVREIASFAQAAEAFREILQELREQYVLGYYPSINRNDGAWHEVRVRVKSPGHQVRARGGYYDDQL